MDLTTGEPLNAQTTAGQRCSAWRGLAGGPRRTAFLQHYLRPRPTNHGYGPHTTSVAWPSVRAAGMVLQHLQLPLVRPPVRVLQLQLQARMRIWPATGGYCGLRQSRPRRSLFYGPNLTPTQPYHGAWYTQDPPSLNSFQHASGIDEAADITCDTTESDGETERTSGKTDGQKRYSKPTSRKRLLLKNCFRLVVLRLG